MNRLLGRATGSRRPSSRPNSLISTGTISAMFASRLTMAGVGLRAVQDALGHKSVAMTVRYSHLAPDFLQDVVDKLVPKPAEAASDEPTDTTTDTGAISPEVAEVVHVQ